MAKGKFLKGNSTRTPAPSLDSDEEDRRFDFADKAMASGGYAGRTQEGQGVDPATAPSDSRVGLPGKSMSENPPFTEARAAKIPTSWSASPYDRQRLNTQRGEFLVHGLDASASKIIAVALKSFAEKELDERVTLYKQMFGA